MSKIVLRKRCSGFTVVSNNVISVLKDDPFSAGVYLYLLHLPDNWEFYKTELSRTFRCGIKKLEKTLRRLKSHGLVNYGQERNDKGQFERFTLEIFDTEQPIQPEGQNCRTVKTVRRSGEAIKKEITKEEKIKRERAPAPRASRTPLSDKFKKSFCPGISELIISEEAIRIAKKKNLDVELTANSFMFYAKSMGWIRVDWKSAFLKWLIDEESIGAPKHTKIKTEIPAPRSAVNRMEFYVSEKNKPKVQGSCNETGTKSSGHSIW